MGKVAVLSEYCARKSTEYRCLAKAAYLDQLVGLGNECNDIAEQLELRADYARPRLVNASALERVCPVPSFPSFNPGAA